MPVRSPSSPTAAPSSPLLTPVHPAELKLNISDWSDSSEVSDWSDWSDTSDRFCQTAGRREARMANAARTKADHTSKPHPPTHLKCPQALAANNRNMTRRLYYTDSYLAQIQAKVIHRSEDGLRVTLDETIFYPTSGGQPHDLGTLNEIPVIDVVDENDRVIHFLAAPLSADVIRAQIDWRRRYDHMQQHTGQHLLSAVFEELFQIPTLSFRMSDEVSTIELGTRDLTESHVYQVLLRATELARTNPRIAVTFEDANAVQGLRKASERSGTLRIVELPGIDRSACGGTHLEALAEVLPLQIRDAERIRGNTRVSFVCGNRAVTQTQSDFGILSRVAKVLATSIDRIEPQVAVLQQRLAAAEKENQRLEFAAASRAGLDLYNGVPPSQSDGIRRHLTTETQIDEPARTKARAYASQSKAILLMQSADGVLLSCSPDLGINAGSLLKQVLAKHGAKGGGSPTLAQGSLTDPAVMIELKRELGIDLSTTGS